MEVGTTIDDLVEKLKKEGKEDILELIEDAKNGELEEIELVESIGLLVDLEDNKRLLNWFEQQGVNLIYVTDDEE
jgi:DNA invertase Pin-like site-specific DNA recombinase